MVITTVHKAGLRTVGDLYNLVTKNVTKYAVLTTLKILKITKKNISNFFEKIFRHFVPQIFSKIGDFFLQFWRIFKVVRTAYFVTFFVTRLYKSPTLLKPALYTVVQISKKFSKFQKNFSKKFTKFYPFFTRCDAMNFYLLFQNLKIAKSI